MERRAGTLVYGGLGMKEQGLSSLMEYWPDREEKDQGSVFMNMEELVIIHRQKFSSYCES